MRIRVREKSKNTKTKTKLVGARLVGVGVSLLVMSLSLISGTINHADAQHLNQVKLRGNATRVDLDYWDLYPGVIFESRVWLYETGAGFSQSSWFTCPTGSCVNPTNLLGCQCRVDTNDPNSTTATCSPILVSDTPHASGHKETWECPDPLYKRGNCLGMTGFLNYEGGDMMRPFMVYLSLLDKTWCE